MTRQDSTTDQMATVLRLAVEHGCYDAHDWLVAAWGRRHGACADAVEGYEGRRFFCDLTAGHDGAHQAEQDGSGPPMRWIRTPPLSPQETP